ncbi:MAG: Rieske (2Fe-2S) protein [Candidatus Thermoplasmatota archaeon]|jgi:nitrite reductase/ring-hydroxylating ferredoxin subunit|nr:Rieske (2Fe-2S) protein [Candidatus Thermoplasmatota archaeon]
MVWHKTISVKALEKAGGASVKLGEEVVFLSKVNGKLYAMNGVCSHAKCILGDLEPSELKVRCLCHDAKFELDTGKMVAPPFVAPNAPMEKLGLKTYSIKEENGFIEVDL